MTGALRSFATLTVAFVGAVSACGGGQKANTGLTEPIQVSGGQFISGTMPGTPPFDGGKPPSSEAGADASVTLPPLTVQSVLNQTNDFVVPGLTGTSISGLVSSDAVAVGVVLENEGTGYWVIPVQGEDVQVPGTRDFGFSVSFNRDDAPGFSALRVVALGASGKGGLQYDSPLCIESRVPDNGHACSESKTPPPVPAAVFALTWDTAFDVDLTVVTPSGSIVNPKTDTTTTPYVEGGTLPQTTLDAVGLYDGTVGVIDRDSMGNCVVDGWREEDLVFQDYPETGSYLIYADPFESCGQAAVRFTLTIYEPAADGNLHATFTHSGELLGNYTTGGEPPDGGLVAGLFVAQKDFD